MKRVLSSCAPCKRTVGKTYVYPGPPPLPEERVKFSVPFQTVGVDYRGAITLSGDGREVVGSIIFVCSLVPQRGPYIWNWPRICRLRPFCYCLGSLWRDVHFPG